MSRIKLDVEVARKAIRAAIEELGRDAIHATHPSYPTAKTPAERSKAISAHFDRTRDAVIHLAELGDEGVFL